MFITDNYNVKFVLLSLTNAGLVTAVQSSDRVLVCSLNYKKAAKSTLPL
jgi:energy-converting hydrogenase Eha subunit H